MLWTDFNAEAGTISITGKVFRAAGQGLQRHDTAKTDAGLRTLPLPRFAVHVLEVRRQLPFIGEQLMIFPSRPASS